MISKIDHLGIAVPNLEEGIELYKSMGFEYCGREVVEEQKVETAFFKVGESMIELLAPTDPSSPIARFIQKNGGKGGIAHIAVNVPDLKSKLESLKKAGLQLIDETPKTGAHGASIAFVHPKSTGGVLFEFCQKKDQ